MNRAFNRKNVACLLLLITMALTALPLKAGASQSQASAQGSAFTVDDALDVVNVRTADLSDDGRWLAATAASLRDRIGIDNYRYGDPTYVAPSLSDVWIIDTHTVRSQKLFSDKRQVRGLKWSPDGSRLALLVLKGEAFEPLIWERASGKLNKISLPKGMYAAENAEFEWTADGSQLIFAIRPDEWRKKAREQFERLTKVPVVVQSSKEPFLAWEELRRMSAIRSIIAHDIKSGETRELIPETRLGSYDVSEDGSFITYLEDMTKKTDYDVIFGADNQVQVMSTAGGQSRTVIKSTKGIRIIWSRDGRRYAYSKNGDLFTGTIDDKEARQITGKKEEKTSPSSDKPKETDSDKEKKEKERFNAVRLDQKGDWMIASTKEGLWLMNTSTGARELLLKTPEEDEEAPRYQITDWSRDGESIYLTYASRTEWERGLVRYSVKEKKIYDLIKDGRLYSGFQLSADGSTFVFTMSEGNRPSDIYAAAADLKNMHRLTEANPQIAQKRFGKTGLISYLDADGKKTKGVLYYPANYEPGKKYPTIFVIYEQFFDDRFNSMINVLTANGYAVMEPSVNFETGFPGEAWAKGVTSAANKLVEEGIADPDRLGVHGTSYGGYATNLLITQTDRFKAAINISGKVNMISFYTDSPRLGVRNIHAPEKSQDRIGATLWQQPQKYIQHSAIMFADRIKTPLLLMTGEEDHNVPARQAMEMYYALRRLGKEVEWVSYTNGGHGMPTTTIEEVKDYHARIIAWYDSHLKGDLKKKGADKKAEDPQQ